MQTSPYDGNYHGNWVKNMRMLLNRNIPYQQRQQLTQEVIEVMTLKSYMVLDGLTSIGLISIFYLYFRGIL
jgi:hypothetical protein